MNDILCRHCCHWVDCKTNGFCLDRDLFTYTEETECSDYLEGVPMTESEYEYVANPANWKTNI